MIHRVIAMAALMLALTGCQSTSSRVSGLSSTSLSSDMGGSVQSAIVIKAGDERDGVAQEYAWLAANMPGAKVLSQTLKADAGLFDVIEVRQPNGARRDVYFDISSFFGKSKAHPDATGQADPKASRDHLASDPMFQFPGVWEGRIELFDAPRFANGAGHTINVRFVIDANGAHVFTGEVGTLHNPDFDWREVKPGQFDLVQNGAQAVVTATTTGHDKDGLWVESSTYTLVHDSPNTLVVYWVRAVNNLDLPADNPDHHFAWGGSGRFHRVDESDVPMAGTTR
ncbi:hypothetical protein DVT68_16970 [Dyella solisilvae]|uniref:Uncharacterized protein n=1 Tax=Dyella solisilvae TaxID=1920168 RepID=A0A370K4S7_9GAMM|nr:hypothetical protein [Dyella solisilvae]RDI97437.1 hypothetical protein DVT68_16970 [Dyella solisilvae]